MSLRLQSSFWCNVLNGILYKPFYLRDPGKGFFKMSLQIKWRNYVKVLRLLCLFLWNLRYKFQNICRKLHRRPFHISQNVILLYFGGKQTNCMLNLTRSFFEVCRSDLNFFRSIRNVSVILKISNQMDQEVHSWINN